MHTYKHMYMHMYTHKHIQTCAQARTPQVSPFIRKWDDNSKVGLPWICSDHLGLSGEIILAVDQAIITIAH